MATFSDAISGIESGGNYGLLGPLTKGDRAYGKYQVMGKNIPEWTRAALGTSLTPDQFLANPVAQEAVFQHKFGQYVDKYGPEGAAKAWFAGERGMNNPNAKDVLGTSVSDYASKFMKQVMPDMPPPINVGAAPNIAPPQSSALPVSAATPQTALPQVGGLPAYGWSQPQQQTAQPTPFFQLDPIRYYRPQIPYRA